MEFTKDDIRNIVAPEPKANYQVLHTMRTDSDEAYERLKIIRDTHKDLETRLNRLTRDMPYQTRVEYERMFICLEKLEKSEIENIKFGE